MTEIKHSFRYLKSLNQLNLNFKKIKHILKIKIIKILNASKWKKKNSYSHCSSNEMQLIYNEEIHILHIFPLLPPSGQDIPFVWC